MSTSNQNEAYCQRIRKYGVESIRNYNNKIASVSGPNRLASDPGESVSVNTSNQNAEYCQRMRKYGVESIRNYNNKIASVSGPNRLESGTGEVVSVNKKNLPEIEVTEKDKYLKALDEWVETPDGTRTDTKKDVRLKIRRNLEKLDMELRLDHMGLVTMPPLFHLTHLRFLNMSCNRIQVLRADDLLCLTSLEALQLQANRLKKIPKDLFAQPTMLATLKLIDIGENQIGKLETSYFSGLGNLEVFWAMNNPCPKWSGPTGGFVQPGSVML